MLLQVLTHSPEKLGWIQLECCKRTNQQCKLLAMLAFAELQGAALQEVCGCTVRGGRQQAELVRAPAMIQQ
jgi:hypothetical protein